MGIELGCGILKEWLVSCSVLIVMCGHHPPFALEVTVFPMVWLGDVTEALEENF